MLKTGNNAEGSNVDMWPNILERKIHRICQYSHFSDKDSSFELAEYEEVVLKTRHLQIVLWLRKG